MPLPKKPYRTNTTIFYIFVLLAVVYIGYAIIQGGAQYQKEKRASSEEYRESYIAKIDSFRTLEEEQINSFLRYYENQAGEDSVALMETYAEELRATEKEKLRYFSATEPPSAFVGYQAYSYMASSLIVEGLTLIIDNNEAAEASDNRDFNSGVLMLERGLDMLPVVTERYNTAKNLQEIEEEQVEK